MRRRIVTVCIFVLLTLLVCPMAMAAPPVLGDINGDGAVNATDVQLVINEALGIPTGFDCDINRSGTVDATDVQVLINGALGIVIGEPVPDVLSLTRAAAETAITNAGFLVGTVTEVHSYTVPTGNVVSQVPAGGSLAVTGTVVSLTVSLGPSGQPGQTITIILPGSVPLELVWIPAGTFMMGRYQDEQDSFDWEDPQHQVTLTQGFWLGKYEVTKAQWEAVMGTTPWASLSDILNDPNSPAVYVSWNDAQAFITAVNALGQGTFRLPTEAQWEYACRAGTTARFYWGNDPSYTVINDYAWWYGNTGEVEYARTVGLKLPNAWGLYDMSGNAWEWCQDWWYASYPPGAVTDPTGPASGEAARVIRGSSNRYPGYQCRSAFRFYGFQTGWHASIGFRLARLATL